MFQRLLVNRWLHVILLLGLLFGTLYMRVQDYNWTRSLRYLAFDAYNQFSPREQTQHAVIVDIDEASLGREGLGQWPWSRDAIAKIVRELNDMGAKAIVFDMVFAEKDRTSPSIIETRLSEEYRTAEVSNLLNTLPDNDKIFADTISELGNVVTAFIWSNQEDATRRNPVLSKPMLLTPSVRDLPHSVPRINAVASNIPELSRAAAGNGCFGVQPEIDGIIRRIPLLFNYTHPRTGKELLYPSLALEALRVAQGAKTITKIRALKPEEAGLFSPPLQMSVGRYEIPFDWDGLFYVYFSKERSHSYIPAWQVFEGQVDATRVKDKVVFIGTSAEGLKDIRSTPLDLFIPGVEVHANVVEQVMSGKYLVRPELLQGVELLTVALTGLIIIFVSPFVGAIFMAIFTFTLIGAFALASWVAFQHAGMLLDPVYPGLCLLALFILSSLLTYMRTEAERRQIKDAFGHYISPDYMKELTNNPDSLQLGGETRDLTIMFTDIRSFTTISESLTPEELIQLMNDFLTPMSDLVMEMRGTIDKYMGDAMMAFWNAPLDDPDHAYNACIAALRMDAALKPINVELEERSIATGTPLLVLRAGIGINSGPASVGNMGSKQRFAYSCLGDTVNLASRLEMQTKGYGVDILIGGDTYNLAGGPAGKIAALELDLLQVKGKTEPARIYTLLGDEKMATDTKFKNWEGTHKQLIRTYRERRFDDALQLIDQCEKVSEGRLHGFYKMFAERIKETASSNLPDDWDGVYVATSKS
jgi:adenylate cyclase